jgi:hypothetical protein
LRHTTQTVALIGHEHPNARDLSVSLSSEHTGTGDGAATNFAGVRREAEPPQASA